MSIPADHDRHFHPFVPALGPLEHRLFRLSQQLTGTPLDAEVIRDLARNAAGEWRSGPSSERKLRWALSLSILSDILTAGGTIHTVDSSLHVAWPDWSTDEGRAGLRHALESLRGEMRYGRVAPEVISTLSPALPPTEVVRLVDEGQFSLMEAGDIHPSGVAYGDIFSAARRYWTMPHRDREGRNRRLVMTVSHKSLRWPLPAGILEVGDASPIATERDTLLGLTPSALSEWLRQPQRMAERLHLLSDRLEAIHGALLPIPGIRIRRADFGAQFAMIGSLEEAAAGRSKGEEQHVDKKRTAYLARLLRGLRAVADLRDERTARPEDLQATARLMRDLTVPRVTLELTLCGALPPFSQALLGKLVVAFAGDPRIRGVCKSDPGEILGSVFDLSILKEQLPSAGAVLLTTKGLFPHHSAQYSRAELPRKHSDLRVPVKKIGETTGITASLMSKSTYDLAKAFLDLPHQQRMVASAFGTGGSKRQRRIEAAVSSLGLPEGIIHPRLQRPIYAAELALNLRDVAIANRRPQWAVSTATVTGYASEAYDLWRSQWLTRAKKRMQEWTETRVPGLQEFVAEAAHAEG